MSCKIRKSMDNLFFFAEAFPAIRCWHALRFRHFVPSWRLKKSHVLFLALIALASVRKSKPKGISKPVRIIGTSIPLKSQGAHNIRFAERRQPSFLSGGIYCQRRIIDWHALCRKVAWYIVWALGLSEEQRKKGIATTKSLFFYNTTNTIIRTYP